MPPTPTPTPTRITTTTATTKDDILVNREMFYQNGSVDYGLSDDHLIYTSRKHRTMPKQGQHIKCPNFKKFSEVADIDWADVLNATDPLSQLIFFSQNNAAAWMSGDCMAHVDEKSPVVNSLTEIFGGKSYAEEGGNCQNQCTASKPTMFLFPRNVEKLQW